MLHPVPIRGCRSGTDRRPAEGPTGRSRAWRRGALAVTAAVVAAGSALTVPAALAGQAEAARQTVSAERIALSGQTAPTLDDLAWIEGHWVGEAFGGEIEEAWLGPSGGSLTGLFRLVRNGTAEMYELLLLEQDEDGAIHYRFKHLGRGWEPWEDEPLEYRLTEVAGRKATFRSTAGEPPSNAPWWFTYESPEKDRLRVSIHGAGGGAPMVLEMTRHR